MPWVPALIALCLCTTLAAAADWPQWLGPGRNAVSPEKVAVWKEPPRVLWRQPVGEGHSSPVVAGGRVFLHVKVKDKDEEEVLCFASPTGKQLWRYTYPRARFDSPFGVGPRATPAVVEGRVYALGVTGVLTCLEADSGKPVWQVDTARQFQPPPLKFGVSCSPLVEGDKVLVNVGAKGASVVAFGKAKGEVVWKSLDDPASYSSPIVFDQAGRRQVVFLTGANVVSLDPASGEVFWKFPLVDLLSESSTTPIRAGDLLLASSVTYGSVGLRLQVKDSKPAFSQAWKNGALTCYFSTPVPVGKEHVYLVTGGLLPPPRVTLRCVASATGEELWNRPKVGRYHASLLRTGDDKLLMLDDNGNLVLLDPDPKEYRELARARVCGPTWAHPALADGRLYVRDDKELICLQLGE
ncbi:MAG TPA: PQQ-binding-like beta-propeller repeat protein [Gemmataceae bacterium]|nr:PQQ-binding-like beta-propeller repeat protein [Gemmataceae bacterium]